MSPEIALSVLASALVACSCGASPAAPPAESRPTDLAAQLRAAIGETLHDDAQDRKHWRLARRAVSERLLVGLDRAEVARRLGPASVCGSPWPCPGGLGPEDRYYEVGRLPDEMVGGTPVLLVDFDASGRCVAMSTIHTQ